MVELFTQALINANQFRRAIGPGLEFTDRTADLPDRVAELVLNDP